MSNATVAVVEAAGVITEEGQRIAALGPVITRDQLGTSITALRLALAQLERNCHRLPLEHPAAPVPELSTLGPWP